MKILIIICVLAFVACHENDRAPEYPPEEPVADTTIIKVDSIEKQ